MHPELKAHLEYFSKDIIQLADNVYMAFGFAASNVYMIVGDDGVIIIDTTETTAAASNILAEFRKITDLPVKSIILTHSHRDHVSGASVFAGDDNPDVITSDRDSNDPLIDKTLHLRAVKAMQARTKRQFGIGLSYPDENYRYWRWAGRPAAAGHGGRYYASHPPHPGRGGRPDPFRH